MNVWSNRLKIQEGKQTRVDKKNYYNHDKSNYVDPLPLFNCVVQDSFSGYLLSSITYIFLSFTASEDKNYDDDRTDE